MGRGGGRTGSTSTDEESVVLLWGSLLLINCQEQHGCKTVLQLPFPSPTLPASTTQPTYILQYTRLPCGGQRLFLSAMVVLLASCALLPPPPLHVFSAPPALLAAACTAPSHSACDCCQPPLHPHCCHCCRQPPPAASVALPLLPPLLLRWLLLLGCWMGLMGQLGVVVQMRLCRPICTHDK